jgi:hypothetical protein
MTAWIITTSIMSGLFGLALILAYLFLPVSPWISLVIFVGFWFLPFKKILKIFPGTQPIGRIDPPFKNRVSRDNAEL